MADNVPPCRNLRKLLRFSLSAQYSFGSDKSRINAMSATTSAAAAVSKKEGDGGGTDRSESVAC